MERASPLDTRQIPVARAFNVQTVERQLNELWKQNAGAAEVGEDAALMRARVLNLLVYVSSESVLHQVNEVISEIAAVHPCRAITMNGMSGEADQDIEMYVSAHCPIVAGAGARHLCCEQVTLTASGRFVVELPSAAMPLLVPDLPVFIWWRGAWQLNEQNFKRLSRAVDRIILDSADFESAHDRLAEMAAFLGSLTRERPAISDLNWARLTSWRTLLANFYNVQEYRVALESISRVRIEYVALNAAPEEIAPQALMLAGWLASRLGWRVLKEQHQVDEPNSHLVVVENGGSQVSISFHPVEPRGTKQGRTMRVDLQAESRPVKATFIVSRSEDGRYLETQVIGGTKVRAERVVMYGGQSDAELLSRELEILARDRVYEQSIATAVEMIRKNVFRP